MGKLFNVDLEIVSLAPELLPAPLLISNAGFTRTCWAEVVSRRASGMDALYGYVYNNSVK